MFCKVCGKEINDQAVVCPNCGCAQQNMNQGYGGYQQGGYQQNDLNEPANGGLWTCPSCGEQNGGKSNICLSCGADKPSSTTFGSSTNRMQLETTDTDGRWTCRACGKINRPGVGACLGCGRSRNDTDKPANGGLIVLTILIPLVGVILGIVNLATGKKRSGKVYLTVGIVAWVVNFIILIILGIVGLMASY